MAEEPKQDAQGVRQDSLLHKPWVGLAIASGVALAVVLAVVLIVYVPLGLRWYLSPTTDVPISQRKDLVQGIAAVGQALAVGLTGAAGLIGLAFTWQNLRQTRESTQRTLELTEQGQITERFTRAIDQLGATDDKGNPRLEMRLGGIYALERIDKESPERAYHSTVMEVLTAYVRENAPWPPKSAKSPEEDFKKPPGRGSVPNPASDKAAKPAKDSVQGVEPTSGTARTDIQAVLDVLKRREEDLVRLDLRRTDLQGANLQGADLQGANLLRANLLGTYELTQEQIEWTIGLNEGELRTKLPEGLNRPQLWSKSREEQRKVISEHIGGG